MTKRIFATLSSFALLTAAAAFAQSGTVMRVDIPFAFQAGTSILPAGHYEVTPQRLPGVLWIHCDECNASAMILTNAVAIKNAPKVETLVFNRFVNTYFLAEVRTPGYSEGRLLPKPKAERELARGSSSSTIEIAAARR